MTCTPATAVSESSISACWRCWTTATRCGSFARLPAVDGVRHACRRHAAALRVATSRRNGIPIWTTSARRSRAARRPSSSSTRTTPPARSTRARCCRSSSTSRASTTSSSSRTRSTTASSWTVWSISPSPRWRPTCFCVTFSGLSKSHMVAGYRIGWMVLSGDKARARDYILGVNMLCNMRMCSNVPAQSIVQTDLGGHQSVQSYIVPGGPRVEAARVRVQRAERHPRRDRGGAQGGLLHLPKLDVEEVQHHGRREVRARPAAREAPARGARWRLQLEEARPLPRGVPAAHRGAGRCHARPRRLPGPLSASVRAPGSGASRVLRYDGKREKFVVFRRFLLSCLPHARF